MRGRKPIKIELQTRLPVVSRLSAVWPLAERVGTTCYNRRHQGRYGGTLATGANRPTWYEQGLSFDGADYWETAEGLSPDGIGTTGCWFIMSSFGSANRYLFSNYVSVDAQRRDCYVTSAGNLGFRVVTPFTDSGVALSNGVLYHAALTWQTDVGWTGYLDGKAVAADSSGTLTAGARTRFGAWGGSTSNAYIGRILWSYASPYRLAAEEIAELHRLGAGIFARPPLSVVWAAPAGGGQAAGAVAFDAEGALAAAGARRQAGAVALGAEGSLSAAGSMRVLGAAEISAEASLAAAGARHQAGAVGFEATAALAAAGSRRMAGAVALSAEASLDVLGALRSGGVVSLSSDGTLSIDGAARAAGAVAFSAEGLLSIASQAGVGAVEFTGDASVEFVGRVRAGGAAAFGADAAITAAGARRQAGAAALSGEGAMAVTARLRHAGEVAFEATVILAISGEPAGDAVSILYILVPDYGALALHRPVYGGLAVRVPEYGDLLLEAA